MHITREHITTRDVHVGLRNTPIIVSTSVVAVSVSETPRPLALRQCEEHPDPLSTRQWSLRQCEGNTPLNVYMSAAADIYSERSISLTLT